MCIWRCDYAHMGLTAVVQRLRILHMLQGREMYAREIVDRMSLHQSVVSRHLSFLRAVGLVTIRKHNNMKFFSLNPEITEQLSKTLDLFAGAVNREAVRLIFYVHEKLRDLESERLKDQLFVEPETRVRPIFGGLIAVAGRTLRRTGEGLESWASASAAEGDKPLLRRTVR